MSLIVIPARYSSSRFPGKPLALIKGKPMIIHVYERAKNAKLASKVIIATDDMRIFNTAKEFNADVRMTDSNLKSGTDRVYEVAKNFKYEIIVNVQGDEPLIEPEVIDNAIKVLKDSKNADISTAAKAINNPKEISDPNVVKVVFNRSHYALYFSRSPIPFCREKNNCKHFKHIGIYCFKRSALEKFVSLPESELENYEKLEQLRALDNDMKIKIFFTDYESFGVDTPEDLEKLKVFLSFNNKN